MQSSRLRRAEETKKTGQSPQSHREGNSDLDGVGYYRELGAPIPSLGSSNQTVPDPHKRKPEEETEQVKWCHFRSHSQIKAGSASCPSNHCRHCQEPDRDGLHENVTPATYKEVMVGGVSIPFSH